MEDYFHDITVTLIGILDLILSFATVRQSRGQSTGDICCFKNDHKIVFNILEYRDVDVK